MDRIRDDSLELNKEVQRIYELLGKVSDQELRRMAKLLAVTGDHELFGQTELALRDRVQPLGAQALEAVAEERHKQVLHRIPGKNLFLGGRILESRVNGSLVVQRTLASRDAQPSHA